MGNAHEILEPGGVRQARVDKPRKANVLDWRAERDSNPQPFDPLSEIHYQKPTKTGELALRSPEVAVSPGITSELPWYRRANELDLMVRRPERQVDADGSRSGTRGCEVERPRSARSS